MMVASCFNVDKEMSPRYYPCYSFSSELRKLDFTSDLKYVIVI